MEQSFMGAFRHGLGLVSSAFGVISRERLGYVYIFIIAIAIVWFSVGGVMVGYLSDWIVGCLTQWLQGVSWMPSVVTEGLGWLATLITYLFSFFVLGFVGGSVVLCAMSPVFSHMADKMYTLLTHKHSAAGVWQLVVSIARGVMVSLINIVLQVSMHIVVFIISFVPAVGMVAPFLAVGVNSYFFGSSMVDYSMELHQMDIKQSFRFSRTHIGLMLGIGFPYALAICVPWIGTYIALFLAPAITVAGSLAMAEVHNYDVRK